MTEKMVINSFLSPFLTPVLPSTKKILVIDHMKVTVLLIIQTLQNLLAWGCGSQSKRKYLFKSK